jgi:MSHA pilin protein MshC
MDKITKFKRYIEVSGLLRYTRNDREVSGLRSFFRIDYATGFTLVELTLALLLIGLLAAAALPKFFTTSTYQFRFFYSDLLSSIRYAQKYAIATGCHTQVTATAANNLILNRAASCQSGAFTAGVFDPTNNSSTYTHTAPGTVTYSSSSATPIYFDGLGRAHNTPITNTGVDNGILTSLTITVGAQTITVIGETGLAK